MIPVSLSSRFWFSLFLAFLSGTVAGCFHPSATIVQPSTDGHPLIAILSAYSPETDANRRAFLGKQEPTRTQLLHGAICEFTQVAGHDVVILPCGVSMVNAAMMTQSVIDRLGASTVLFAGIAGGISPEHHIGDVVIPERWAHHSEAAYFNPKTDGTGFVLEAGYSNQYENFGFIFPEDVKVTRDGMDGPVRKPFFNADPVLLAVAREAIQKSQPVAYEGRTIAVSVGGTGISGPVFCDNRLYRQWAFRVWHAECLDMESTAIAQVCWANHVPFLIVRSLSDLAGGQDGPNPESFNENAVSEHAANVLKEIVVRLPPEVKRPEKDR